MNNGFIQEVMNVRDKRKVICAVIVIIFVILFLVSLFQVASAQQAFPEINLPDIQINTEKSKTPDSMLLPFQMLFMLTLLSLAPYILVMVTSFTRVTIVLSFLRTAMGTQQVPPTQVLMGLALFVTFYIMQPVGKEVIDKAITPFSKKEITWNEFMDKAQAPLRTFMLKNVREKDLRLFARMSRMKHLKKRDDVPIWVLVPAFIVSEITTSFEIGFLIYLPFLVVDMVVACVLMSMGMFMLSPMSISMPFKLLLFVMIDGWELVVESLLKSFK